MPPPRVAAALENRTRGEDAVRVVGRRADEAPTSRGLFRSSMHGASRWSQPGEYGPRLKVSSVACEPVVADAMTVVEVSAKRRCRNFGEVLESGLVPQQFAQHKLSLQLLGILGLPCASNILPPTRRVLPLYACRSTSHLLCWVISRPDCLAMVYGPSLNSAPQRHFGDPDPGGGATTLSMRAWWRLHHVHHQRVPDGFTSWSETPLATSAPHQSASDL